MKKALAVGFLGFAMVIAGVARVSAEKAIAARVGYVDLQRTLNETKVGKQARAKLEGEKKRQQKIIDKMQKDFTAKAEAFKKRAAVLKPEVVQQKQAQLQQEYVQLQDTFMKKQQALSVKEQQLTRQVLKKATAIIESIAKRDGYTILLEKSESAVLWADPGTDITSELNKRLDQ